MITRMDLRTTSITIEDDVISTVKEFKKTLVPVFGRMLI